MISPGEVVGKRMSEVYYSINSLERYMQRARYRIIQTLLKKYRPNSTAIIDIGSADTPYLTKTNSQAICLDIDLPSLQKASAKVAACIVADVKHLPFKENQFDLVLFSEVLEHISQPIESLREIHRILRAKGKLILSTPSKQGIYESKEFVYITSFLKGIKRKLSGKRFRKTFEPHCSLQSLIQLRRKLERCNYEAIEEYHSGFCIPFFGEFLSILLKFNWFVRIYERLDKSFNESQLFRNYNWTMIFVCCS